MGARHGWQGRWEARCLLGSRRRGLVAAAGQRPSKQPCQKESSRGCRRTWSPSMVTQLRSVSRATRAATSRLRHTSVLPNTCGTMGGGWRRLGRGSRGSKPERSAEVEEHDACHCPQPGAAAPRCWAPTPCSHGRWPAPSTHSPPGGRRTLHTWQVQALPSTARTQTQPTPTWRKAGSNLGSYLRRFSSGTTSLPYCRATQQAGQEQAGEGRGWVGGARGPRRGQPLPLLRRCGVRNASTAGASCRQLPISRWQDASKQRLPKPSPAPAPGTALPAG